MVYERTAGWLHVRFVRDKRRQSDCRYVMTKTVGDREGT